MLDGIEDHNGIQTDTFNLVFDLMMENPSLFEGLVTHRYEIDQYKTAFTVASNKGKNEAIKVVFQFDLNKEQ